MIIFDTKECFFYTKECSHVFSSPEVKEYQLQLDQIENSYSRQSLAYNSSSSVTSAEQNGSSDMTLNTSVSTTDTSVSNCNNNNNSNNNNNVSNNKISDNNSNHSTASTTCRTSEYCSPIQSPFRPIFVSILT